MRTIFQSLICVLPFALAGLIVVAPTDSTADTGQYFYDDLGRLQSVADTAGNVAVYNYDAVGNLSSIQRFTPPGSGIGIFAQFPGSGDAGTQVTIRGYGFDATPANNTVTFNGTAATVVSSTTVAIVATVPGAATTGAIAVTNTNGSATSSQNFTIATAPTIASISPSSVVQDSSRMVTITGTQLANATSVTFTQTGITATLLSGGTATTLPLVLSVANAVPTGSYTFSVITPIGTTASGAVTVSVGAPVPNMARTAGHLSVAMPYAPVPATSAPSGRTMTVSPLPSAQMAYPSVPATSDPTGRSMTVTPPVSGSMP